MYYLAWGFLVIILAQGFDNEKALFVKGFSMATQAMMIKEGHASL